jgi:hypothetical protein
MTRRGKNYLPLEWWAKCLILAMVVSLGQVAAGVGSDEDLVFVGTNSAVKEVGSAAGKLRSKSDVQPPARRMEPVLSFAGKRDPFNVPPPPHPGRPGERLQGPLPPGKRGLIIGQLRLEGIVREEASNTLIAVVTNRTNLAYFLRVHDEVFNGVVGKITDDSIQFKENRLDSNGGLEIREVVMKLGSRSGEER